jgi:hypothetical protein
MSAPLDDDALSRLAADALRVISGVQEWARQTFSELDAQAHADGHGATGGPECQWCPLCQFVAVLRGERPELTERVADAGTAIVTALRAALDATARPSAPGQHRADREPRSGSSGAAPRVQRIDLGGPEGGERPEPAHGEAHPDAHREADAQ